MKKLSQVLFIGVFMCTAGICSAQNFKLPAKVAAVIKSKVNIRQAPNSTAAIISKAPFGTVFELVSNKDGWCEVKEAGTGKTAYISSGMVKIFNSNDTSYPKTEYMAGGTSEYPSQFENTTRSSKSELTETYSFWSKNPESNVVYAMLSSAFMDVQGRMRTDETYYKGKQMGWYVILDEKTDSDGNVEAKMETPIFVYWNHEGKSGICVDGKYYMEAGNPFE